MQLRLKLAAAAFAIAATASAAAHAALLLDVTGATGPMPTDTSISYSFNAAGGAGVASFVLDGYGSLDGQNGYEDDFILSLNGVDVIRGTFNLGGGGGDQVYLAPVGATWANVSGNFTNVTWAGGQMIATTPLALLAGLNTLTFSYVSLPSPDHAGFQGTGDEAWGVEGIQVTGAGGVPEPSTWALLLMGFGGLGAMLRAHLKRVGPSGASTLERPVAN